MQAARAWLRIYVAVGCALAAACEGDSGDGASSDAGEGGQEHAADTGPSSERDAGDPRRDMDASGRDASGDAGHPDAANMDAAPADADLGDAGLGDAALGDAALEDATNDGATCDPEECPPDVSLVSVTPGHVVAYEETTFEVVLAHAPPTGIYTLVLVPTADVTISAPCTATEPDKCTATLSVPAGTYTALVRVGQPVVYQTNALPDAVQTDAASCEPSGTCAEPLTSGTFAARVALDVWWDEAPAHALYDAGRGAVEMVLLVHLVDVCDAEPGTAWVRACGLTLPTLRRDSTCDAYQLEFDDEIWDARTMPRFGSPVHASGFEPEDKLYLFGQTVLAGLELNSIDGAFPDAAGDATCPAGTGAVCFPDDDDDAERGITAHLTRIGQNASETCGSARTPLVYRGFPLGSASATSDDTPRALELHLGVRAPGSSPPQSRAVIDATCTTARGTASAAGPELRSNGCRKGSPADPSDLEDCAAGEAEFVDAMLPRFHALALGEAPPRTVTLPNTQGGGPIDQRSSAGPRLQLVRLGDLSDTFTCEDARAAAGSAGSDLPAECPALAPQPGEECYDFPLHGSSSPTDSTPFRVETGEQYSQLYYNVPWPAGSVGTRYGVLLSHDDLHAHAWAFDSSASQPHGTVERNVTGTLLGLNARMVAPWSAGPCAVGLPDSVGLQLPDPGRKLIVQWHHANATGAVQQDTSRFRVCTVPAAKRTQTAAFTVLGSENFNGVFGIPAGTHSYGEACANDSSTPIFLVGVLPHSHRLATRSETLILPVAGGQQVALDEPFAFGTTSLHVFQPQIGLATGDRVRSTCTFVNDTGENVAFGQSLSQEMCYQFALASPVGALDNGVLSLMGVTNTCWDD